MAADIISQYKEIESLLSQNRLLDSIRKIRKTANEEKYSLIAEKCGELEDEYRRMLYYLQEGMQDPARLTYFNDYIVKARILFDLLKKNEALKKDFSLYYSQCRTENSRKSNISVAISNYYKACDSSSIFNAISEGKNDEQDAQIKREQSLKDLFNVVWVSFPINAGEKQDLLDFFKSEVVSDDAKVQLLPALLLSVLQYFDSDKVELLIKLYCIFADKEKSAVAPVSLTAAIIALLMYGYRPVKSSLTKAINEATALPSWNDDIKTVLLELIKTIDTERIGQKIKDEILPELRKVQKDINKMFSEMKIDEETFDISQIEENPEWMESLQNSKFANKMQEIFKLQSEGGDIFMSAFNQLKMFPFFNDIANWFAPFSEDSSIVPGDEDGIQMARLVKKIPNVCDSDKYSIMLLYSGNFIPQSQKDSILNQVKMNNLNMAGVSNDDSEIAVSRKSLTTNFVQNLYRFFKLYRRKSEFNSPFDKPFDIAGCKHLALLGNTTDTEINLIAEFYFKHKYYDEALKLFLYLDHTEGVNAQRLQKIGFCYQRHAEIEKALNYYKKAELMESGSLWTIKKIVQCLQLLNRHREALEYIEDLCITNPDDTQILLQKAGSLIALQKFDKAIPVLTKANYLNKDSIASLRLLAFCQYRIGKFDAAINSFKKIVSDAPQANDYVIMGNISMAQGDFREAINCYELASERHEKALDGVIEDVKKSQEELKSLGVDTSILPMLLDCLVRV